MERSVAAFPFVAFGAALATALVMLAVTARAFARPGAIRFTPVGAGQVLLIVAALAGAALHTFPTHAAKDDGYPSADLVTLAFLALVIVAIMLPKLSSLEVGGFKLGIRDQLVAEVSNVQKNWDLALAARSSTLAHWSGSLSTLVEHFWSAPGNATLQTERLRNFVRDRLTDVRRIVAVDDASGVRLAVWIYDADGDDLRFWWSNEIADDATTSATFHRCEGFLGSAFDDGSTWNETGVTTMPGYKRTSAPATYDAVLVTPIMLGPLKLGMLSADWRVRAVFPPDAVEVARGLASLVAVALWQFQTVVVAARPDDGDALQPDDASAAPTAPAQTGAATAHGLTRATVALLVADGLGNLGDRVPLPVTERSAGVALAKARTSSATVAKLVDQL